jgi:hypothetical protein
MSDQKDDSVAAVSRPEAPHVPLDDLRAAAERVKQELIGTGRSCVGPLP